MTMILGVVDKEGISSEVMHSKNNSIHVILSRLECYLLLITYSSATKAGLSAETSLRSIRFSKSWLKAEGTAVIPSQRRWMDS